jgi:hypothetical protein
MTSRRTNPVVLFGLFALLVNFGLAWLLRYDHRSVIAAASCADFLVSLPAIYYWLVVRAGAQPLVTIIPVLIGGLFRVAYIAPFSGATRLAIAATCECGMAWFLIRRGRQSLAAQMLLSEFTVLRYALASWGMKPDVPSGGQAFSMHKNGGVATMFGLIAGLSSIEAACVHLVVYRWSATGAWIVFALSLYGALLLLALARSFHLRPIVVTPHGVLIRSGLIWNVSVAAENIARVATSSSDPEFFKVCGMAEPNVFLELHSSVLAEGFYGRRKSVRCIGISADEPGELLSAINTIRNAAR